MSCILFGIADYREVLENSIVISILEDEYSFRELKKKYGKIVKELCNFQKFSLICTELNVVAYCNRYERGDRYEVQVEALGSLQVSEGFEGMRTARLPKLYRGVKRLIYQCSDIHEKDRGERTDPDDICYIALEMLEELADIIARKYIQASEEYNEN